MTYLVLRFQSVGNVAMTVPVLESASRLQPDDTFVVVGKKRLHAMFHGLDNVYFHEVDLGDGSLKRLMQLFRELKAYNIDKVIDLQDVFRTQVLRALFRLHGVSNSVIHYGRMEKRLITKLGLRRDKVLPTEFQRYADTFRRAGLQTDEQFTALPVNHSAGDEVVERFGEKRGKWIGLAPFAKSKTNILPYPTVKSLLARLSELPDTRVFLFGAGKVECELLRQWADSHDNVVSVAGELPLSEELELMRKLDVMLCMDSANQHLASLVGLRTISIWCGTHPKMGFYGWKQKPEDCVQIAGLACRPCTMHGTNICRYGNYTCKQITENQIITKI